MTFKFPNLICFLLCLIWFSLVQGQDTYLDNFSSNAYNNSDGNQNWSGNSWTENGDDNSATGGFIRVTGGELRFRWLFGESITRTANLTGAGVTSATLLFGWRTESLESGENLDVQISSDGVNFTTLLTISGTGTNTSNRFSQDISAYISATTTIRFIQNGANWSGNNDRVFIDNVLILGNSPSGTASCTTLSSSPGTIIPDLSTITSNLSGFTSGTISDVNITLDITHTWNGDLDISITSPAGTTVILSVQNGGAGQNYTNTVFDDAATTPITLGSAPFTGTFWPEEALAAFNGEDPSGTWVLSITDNAGADTGILNSFSIEVCTISLAPDTDGDTIFDDVDLDDDNDGILDTVECNITTLSSTPTPDGVQDGNYPAGYWDAEYYDGHFGVLGSTFGSTATDNNNSGANGTPVYLGEAYFEVNSLTFTDTRTFVAGQSPTAIAVAPSGYAGTNSAAFTTYYQILFNRLVEVDGTLEFGGTGFNSDDIFEVYINGVQQGFYGNCCGAQSPSIARSIAFSAGDQLQLRYANFGGSGGYQFNVVLNYDCPLNSDGITNGLDLDSDNDGIYDVVEAGHDQAHTNGRLTGAVGTDGIPDIVQASGQENSGMVNYTVQDSDSDGNYDFLEIDSDNDSCNDVVEAGFTDDNDDGILGPTPVTVDANGVVTSGSDGYTTPDDIDTNTTFDYREAGASPSITLQPMNQNSCEGSGASFSVTATGGGLTYQWQVSTNEGLAFNDVTNGGIYSGVTTNTLTISGESEINDGEQYRVVVNSSSYVCGTATTSNVATLTIQGALSVNAGPDDTLCSNSTYVLDGRVFNAASITWSGSTGLSSTNIANPTYTPTAAEITAGTVTLTLTADGIGLCAGSPIVDMVTLTIAQGPTADAGADDEFCSNETYTLDGTATNQSSIAWSRSTGGTTGISNATLEDPVFTPTAADITAGTVTLNMSVYGLGSCNPLGVPDYLFRKKITVDPDQVIGSSDFSNYALLVNTTDIDLRTTANGGNVESTNGYDIVFTASDGTTLLSHQLEKYDPLTGELATWVGIPTLSTTSDTVIYMYYGNATAVDTSTNGIWAANYQTILHMGEDPSGASPQILDATPNGNSGAVSGMVAGNSVPGLMGNALTFDEVDDYVQVPDFDYTGSNAFTVSFWFKIADNTGTAYQYMYSHGTFDTTDALNIYLGEDNVGPSLGEDTFRTLFQDSNDATNYSGLDAGTATYVDGQWHLYTFTTGTSGNPRVYLDGVERANISFNGGDSYNPGSDIFIGARSHGLANRYFGGELDEVRILNTSVSTDLIRTEYNNQSVPDDFYHIGAETDLNPVIDSITLTISPEPTVDTQPVNQTVFTGNNAMFSVSASNVDTYQWQVSTDGGTNFNNISDGPEYTNTQTTSLTVNNVELNKNGYRYRVQVSNSGNSCTAIFSNSAILNTRVRGVITNRRITYRVNKN